MLMGTIELGAARNLHLKASGVGPVKQYDSLRVFFTTCFLIASNCISSGVIAQSVPFGPLFPKSARECLAFSRQVQDYEAAYSAQHEQCLADHPADRQEAPNSPTCSRSSCQFLHDRLFGNSSLSAASLQAEVSACSAKVAEYERGQAEEQAEEAERVAKQAQREQEREKEDADRAARRQQERDARDRQNAISEAARQKEAADLSAAERKAAADRLVQLQAIAAATAQQTATKPRSNASETPLAADPQIALVDPFSGVGKIQSAGTDASSRLVDPFAKNQTLVDPFGSSDNKKAEEGPAEINKFTYEASTRILEESMNRVDAVLAQDISGIQSQAGKSIGVAKAAKAIETIKETQSVLRGLTHLLSGAQYAVLTKNIVSAESPAKRDEATGEALKQIASDVIHRDAVKNGMTEVSLRLFGERVGPLLVRAAAPAMAAGGIIFDSEKTGRDPVEIIHDASGKVSLAEKQSALMEEWRGYERVQAQTNKAPNPSLQQAIWIDSNIVYNQCLNAKIRCEKWMSDVDQR
jgi:hypothetical protein